MTLFLKLIASAAISAAVLLGGVYYGKQNTQPTQTQSFGSFQPVQAAQFTLAGAGITNSQNTIQLASFALPDPNKTPITMAMFGAIGYGVLDPQTSKIENVSFTGVTQNSNGSATLTGVSRGLSFYTPYAASTTLAVSHAGGSTFILSNSGAFYGQQFTFTNNANTFSAVNTFGSTTPPKYDADPVWANFTTQVFADVSYVNSVVAAGCANAATGIKGCVQIATGLQAASSTGTGSTGALLVLPASIATDTPNASTNTSKVLMSDLTGHLKQTWLDLSASWAFTGVVSIIANASSKFTLNGLAYVWPLNRAASSTVLSEDGSGNLSFEINKVTTLAVKTADIPFTGTTPTSTAAIVQLSANTLNSTQILRVNMQAQNKSGSNTCTFGIQLGTGTATTTIGYILTSGTTPHSLSGTIFSTSTASAISAFAGQNNSSYYYTGTFEPYSTTGILYIAFVQSADISTTCSVLGYSIEQLTN